MAKNPKDFNVSPEIIEVYRRMVAAVDGVEIKGKNTPYTSINGNMYSSISKMERIGLRLHKDDMQEFIEKYDAELFEPFEGFIQKTYVEIPESIYPDTRALRHWFRKCHAYASSLKPKPTTKKK